MPVCWDKARGALANPTQFEVIDLLANNYEYWRKFSYLNQTSSTNYAAKGILYSDTLRHWLISPPYNLGTGNNFNLEFDMALTANASTSQGSLNTDDKFILVISTDEGLTWSSANALRTWAYPEFIPATGQHITIPLGAYSGIVRIGFYIQSTVTNTPSNLFIDNVKISLVTPVTLLDFTGKLLPPSSRGEGRGEAALLQWRTVTEQNNKGFELQRSINGIEFSTISFIPTKARDGSSSDMLSYSFTDYSPLTTHNYYRLKQIDKDGKYTLSNVVFIKGSATEQLVLSALYPNPTTQTLNVVLTSPTPQKAQILITDMAGKLVQQQALQLTAGDNNKVVNVDGLQKGSYILKVVCDNGCEAAVSKFVRE